MSTIRTRNAKLADLDANSQFYKQARNATAVTSFIRDRTQHEVHHAYGKQVEA